MLAPSNSAALTFLAVDGRAYNILSTTNLQTGTWETNAASVSGTAPDVTVTVDVTNANSFFKIELDR